jgi:nucleoid-associated protein YgaU
MRTDVKIGIAGGLVLVVGFVIYMVARSGPAETPDPADPGDPVSGLHDPQDDPLVGGTGGGDGSLDPVIIDPGPVTDVWGSGTPDTPTTGGPDTSGVGAGVADGGTATDGGTGIPDPDPGTGGLAVGVDGGTTDPDPGGSSITMIPSGPIGAAADPEPDPGIADSSYGPSDAGAPAIVPYPDSSGVVTGATDPVGTSIAGAPVVGAAGERMHLIKSGDQLWKVAEMYYGSGKHWQLIVSANPGLNPTSMRIGKTIKIPPLPVSTSGTGIAGIAAADPVTTFGERIYTVKDGDSGMWGVSESQYGHGKYYTAISDRNPTVDSARLKIGQKLIIPTLEKAKAFLSGGSSAAISGTPSIGSGIGAAPLPAVGLGEKIYTVRDGDSGMWGISKSQYGDGKYFTAISSRNPGVNPARLKIGQKLVIPSLEQAKTFIGGSAIRSPSPRPRPAGGVTPRPIPRVRPRPTPRRVPISSDEPDFG